MEKLKFYKSLVGQFFTGLGKKFQGLSKAWKRSVVISLLFLCISLIFFLVRDKPEQVYDYAGKAFSFSPEQDLKPFISYFPSIGEDHLLKKIIVNLKQSVDHPEALGMFEIFVNVRSAFMLQTIKNKEYLIQDVLQRELEGFNYESLSKPQAKKMLKAILKNKVNRALKKKIVKRLYFKTYVIQP